MFFSLLTTLIITGNQINISKAEIEDYQLNQIAWQFAFCESSQIPDLKILDNNGEYSFGMLQFQQRTFDSFGEKYGLEHSDIYSYEQQRDIFKAMWKEDLVKNHWRICWDKLIK